LLLPSSNTTQEPEFARILPDGVSLHVNRLPLRRVEPSSTARIVKDIEIESQKLADADVDAIVLAATAPSRATE
jgi:maleate isomerase